MRNRQHSPWICFLVWVFLAAIPSWLFASTLQDKSRRICVVAVRDSALFTLCPDPGLACGNKADAGQYQLMDTTYPSHGAFPGLTRPFWMLSGWLVRIPAYTGPPARPILERPLPDWQNLARTEPGICPLGRTDPDLKNRIEKELRKQKNFILADTPQNADLIFLAEGISAFYYKQILPTQTRHFEFFGCH